MFETSININYEFISMQVSENYANLIMAYYIAVCLKNDLNLYKRLHYIGALVDLFGA